MAKIPPPRSGLVDKEGRITPEWYRWLSQFERDQESSGVSAGAGIDITAGTVSIADNGVTNSKLRDSSGVSVIGRYANSTGDPADITAGADGRVLMRDGGILVFREITPGSGVLADGDYGDISITAGVWGIDADTVTFAKMQNIVTDRLIGRDTAASGDPEEISVSGGIEFTGSGGIRTTAFTGDATKAAGGTVLTLATVNAGVGTFGSATQAPQFTVNGKGLITAAANVTITPAASSITGGAALTRTDDTNVTLTLGGSPTTALLAATSVIVGWTGTLAVARGGLGVGTITGLMQGNGTSAVTGIANSSTVGQVLRVTGASTYAWGALDLADTDAVTGTLPVANGGTGAATFTNNRILTGNGTSAIVDETNLTFDGSLLTLVGVFTGSGGSFTNPSAGTFRLFGGATSGFNASGNGSAFDVAFSNNAGQSVFVVPTGTVNAMMPGSLGVGSTSGSFGGGVKVISIANATTDPTSNPTGGGVLYCSGGAIKFRGSAGTTTTIAAP